jgi:shikimate dehydrogenase
VSVIVAATELGCREVTLFARAPERAAATVAVVQRLAAAPHIDVRPLGDPGEADLLVSTVPAEAQTSAVVSAITAPAVFEVRYDPWPTPVVVAAREAGATVIGGLDLLVHQAVDQVRLMTGVDDVPLALMRAAGEHELAARASA